ncbi:MAG: PilZ domain-containing protein [Planctomycetota bacterium]
MSDQPIPLQPLSVKLDPDQWAALFDNINLAEQMIPGRDRREHERIDYDTAVTLYAQIDGDQGETRHLVRTRNISSSGVGFIHHGEVVVGTRVRFTAFDQDSNVCELAGTSARADLIEQEVWDIGIRFDELIDLTHLVDMDGQPLLQSAG